MVQYFELCVLSMDPLLYEASDVSYHNLFFFMNLCADLEPFCSC
ncbi:hypothetical protein NBRC111894_352 [Sporolactobacillus inulinus]|uniref:Uncharacterized protein n=1 Tax=Sporolactobacillus inulinus TaxID=2078 RepID=A0A4Y1Z787_9BACL|nr:hypothetical protein NBRC111894_352 [Sporolactobacillus inulinus]